MMPISLPKPIQLDVINFLLVFPLGIPFFQMFPAEGEKAQKGKQFNLHWECVHVCVPTGERSSKTNGFAWL